MHSQAQKRRSGPKAAAAGIVLAGGRSTRMGRPKAALEWHGSTLLRRVAGIVARAVDGPVIVVRAPGQSCRRCLTAWSWSTTRARAAARSRAWRPGWRRSETAPTGRYVSSTDVPLLHPAFVGAVIAAAARDDVDVALPVAHGYRHPLAAAYGASLLGVVEALIADDLLRPAALFERCRVRELDEEALLADRALAEADPNLSSLLNVNDPDEYERARARSAPRVSVRRVGTLAGNGGERAAISVRAATLGVAAAAAGVSLDRRVVAALNGDRVAGDPQLPLAAGDTVAFRAAGARR